MINCFVLFFIPLKKNHHLLQLLVSWISVWNFLIFLLLPAYQSVKCDKLRTLSTTLFTNTQDVSGLQRNQSWGKFQCTWCHTLPAVYQKKKILQESKIKMSISCQILFWFRDLLKSTKQTINLNMWQHWNTCKFSHYWTIAFIKKTRGTILTPVTTTYSLKKCS